jgi:hypothetical protein
MMTPAVAGLRIARQLTTLETQFDRLLAEHAGLTALLAQARVDVAEPFGNGQLPLVRLSKSLEGLVAARGDVARVHAELDRLAQERGDIMTEPKPANGRLVTEAGGIEDAHIAA